MMGERGLAFDLSLAIAFSLLISATVIRHQGVSFKSFLVHFNLHTLFFLALLLYCQLNRREFRKPVDSTIDETT